MIHSALKKVAVGIALIGAVGAANANTYDFGVLNTTVGASNIKISSSFDDIFKFTVGTLPSVIISVVGADKHRNLEAQYSFAIGASPAVWAPWSQLLPVPSDPAGVFSYSQTVGGLALGETYWINVKGSADRASYSVTLAPVPEVDSYAMLLAGLGLMGVIARRRKTSAVV